MNEFIPLSRVGGMARKCRFKECPCIPGYCEVDMLLADAEDQLRKTLDETGISAETREYIHTILGELANLREQFGDNDLAVMDTIVMDDWSRPPASTREP